MDALIIILFVLLLIFFLTLLPLYVKFTYNEDLSVTIRYMFFKFKIYPREKKEVKKKKKSSKPKKKAEKPKEKEEKPSVLKQLKEAIDKTGLDGFLEIIKTGATLVKDYSLDLLNHTIIDKFIINISVSGEDASDCAINYGYVCSVVYPVSGLLLNGVKDYKELNLNLSPDFDATQSTVNAEISIYIPVIWLIVLSVKLIFNSLIQFIKYKSANQDNNLNPTSNKEANPNQS